MKKWKHRGVWLLVLAAGLGLVLFPGEVTDAAKGAIQQCLELIIPSLFPFLVLSSLVIALGGGETLGRRLSPLMGPLFQVSGCGAAALMLGLVGGYPVGARTVRELYDEGLCSREDCGRLLLFCNNCGPAFLLSTAGVAVLGSARAGWLLWLGHCIAAFGVGILFRFSGKQKGPSLPPPHRPRPALSTALISAVTGGAKSALQLSAFVVAFAVLIRLLTVSRVLIALSHFLHLLLAPLGFSLSGCSTLLTGGLEMTRGILSLSGQSPTPAILALAAFLLGWGGFSVHCQTLAVLEGSGLPFSRYLLGKLCHGLLAALVTYSLALIFPEQPEIVTVSYIAPAAHNLLPALVGCAWLGILGLCLRGRKKGGNISANPL